MAGPIIICDKSFIEMIKVDESAFLDQFFNNNLTPILYMETLATLEKDIERRASNEQLLSEIVAKTPQRYSYPNIFHDELVILNLFGEEIKMQRKPLCRAGSIKELVPGKFDMQINQFPEIVAQQKWAAGEFTQLERLMAKEWRLLPKEIDFDKWNDIVKKYTDPLPNLQEAKKFVDSLIKNRGKQYFDLMLDFLEVPTEIREDLLHRYMMKGAPPLSDFAPYAAYVFKIKFFFHLSIYSSHQSKASRSYPTDILYLFYLPFCQVFVSNDKSHNSMIPLFLENDQVFVKGPELKNALKECDHYYSNFQGEIQKYGLMFYALRPPIVLTNEITRLWDKFCPNWRYMKTKASDSCNTSSIERINGIKASTKTVHAPSDIKQLDSILIQRKSRASHGKWPLFPLNTIQKLQDS